MKKLVALLFITVLAVSCKKKETYNQDSNVMLEEPKVQIIDSAAASKATDQTAVTVDSATVIVDSVSTK